MIIVNFKDKRLVGVGTDKQIFECTVKMCQRCRYKIDMPLRRDVDSVTNEVKLVAINGWQFAVEDQQMRGMKIDAIYIDEYGDIK